MLWRSFRRPKTPKRWRATCWARSANSGPVKTSGAHAVATRRDELTSTPNQSERAGVGCDAFWRSGPSVQLKGAASRDDNRSILALISLKSAVNRISLSGVRTDPGLDFILESSKRVGRVL